MTFDNIRVILFYAGSFSDITESYILSSNFAIVGYHTNLLSRTGSKYCSSICQLHYFGGYLHTFSPEGPTEVSFIVKINK